MPDILGESADPSTAQPTNAVQKFFLRNFSLQASHPIMGSVSGALVALVGVLGLSYIFAAILGKILGNTVAQLNQSGNLFSNIIVQFAQEHFLYLVALEHGAYFVAHIPANANTNAYGDITFGLPLTTLLLIPIVCLILGGYISSSTDYSNRLRFAVSRAALVGPFYGILLALIIGIWGIQGINFEYYPITNTNTTFGPMWFSALIYGIIWGTLFSAIGGVIKVYGTQWRTNIIAFAFKSKRTPIVAGILGGFAGIGLSLIFTFIFVIFAIVVILNQTNLAINLHIQSNFAIEQFPSSFTTNMLFIFVFPLMVWFLGLFSGGTLIFSNPIPIASHSLNSLSLFTLPHIYLVAILVPAIAFFFAGRVSLRLAIPQTFSEKGIIALVTGLSEAIILTILAWITQIRVDSNFNNSTFPYNVPNYHNFFGLDLTSTFIWVFFIGVICSLLGIITHRVVITPESENNIKNTLPSRKHNISHVFLILGIILTFLLSGIVVVFDIASKLFALNISFTLLMNISNIVSGASIAISALFFSLAFVTWIVRLPNKKAEFLQESIPQSILPNASVHLDDLSQN